jgi:hypothetical protein
MDDDYVQLAHDLLMSRFNDFAKRPNEYLRELGISELESKEYNWMELDWEEEGTQSLAELLRKADKKYAKLGTEERVIGILSDDAVQDKEMDVLITSINSLVEEKKNERRDLE